MQTNKFSSHIALDELYKGIIELRDKFIESYQGKYGIITGYNIICREGVEIVSYLKQSISFIEEQRIIIKDGYLQQLLDDIIELINITLYKLINLAE